MFENYHDIFDQSVRLAILKLLAEQNDGRLTDAMIEDLLVARYLINKGRGYVHGQLSWLQREARAVHLEENGPLVFVEITEDGSKHLQKRSQIPGIKLPEGRRG